MSSVITKNQPENHATETGNAVPENSLLNYPHLRGLSLTFVLMGLMLHTIDSSIANVALPHMKGSLSATVDQISWVITGYLVAAAIGTPPVAWLSARFGIKKILLTSVSVFTLSSVLCGLSVTLEDLVLYRIFQGLSGAALIPVGQTIVLSAYKREEYTKAMGLFGLGIMFGPIIGPTLGGYITEWFNWRWVFFINLPFGLIAAAGIWFFIRDSPANRNQSFDTLGFLSLVVAMAAFQLFMDRGHGKDWFDSWEIVIWAGLFVTATYVFIVRAITAKEPFFDLLLYKDWNFMLGNFVFFFVGGNMVVMMLMVPIVMQTLQGFSVASAGLLLVPRGVGMMLAMTLSPRLTRNLDPRITITIGLLIAAYATWDQAQMGTYFTAWDFVRTGFAHGLGLGMIFVSIGALTFSGLPDEMRLQASTFYSMMRNVGQSFCAALAMSAIVRNMQVNTSELGQSITVLEKNLQMLLANSTVVFDQSAALAIMQSITAKQAMTMAYINVFFAVSIITLCLVPFIWLFKMHPQENF